MTPAEEHSTHVVRAAQDRLRRLLSKLFGGYRPDPAPEYARTGSTGPAGSGGPGGRRSVPTGPRLTPRTTNRRPETGPMIRQLRTGDGARGVPEPAEYGTWTPADAAAPPAPLRPRLAPTTRTFEMSQLTVLDERLQQAGNAEWMTARDLGLDNDRVPAHARLVAVRWDGPPDYPYIHGQFSAGEATEVIVVDLHTHSLREISRRLGLRQVWGW